MNGVGGKATVKKYIQSVEYYANSSVNSEIWKKVRIILKVKNTSLLLRRIPLYGYIFQLHLSYI